MTPKLGLVVVLCIHTRPSLGWQPPWPEKKTTRVHVAETEFEKKKASFFVGNDGSVRQQYDNGVVLPIGWTGSSVRRRTGARLSTSAWPVGEARANPAPAKVFRRETMFKGLREDWRRRAPFYAEDWIDGLKSPGKTFGAVLFLYFAVLAPAVAFGGVMAAATGGALGPRDVLASCGLSGMAYACFSGQPMTFLAPTGLTLSFIGALSAFTTRYGVPFLPMYAWCGLWTSGLMMLLATLNASVLIRFCTRFTEDVFNALLAFNFLTEGATPLLTMLRSSAASVTSGADALLATDVALVTALSCRKFAGATKSRYFTAKARSVVADFGPAIVIVFFSLLAAIPGFRNLGSLVKLQLDSKSTTNLFTFVDLRALAVPYRLLAGFPAIFLAMLFYLDQHITVRTVNSQKITKGAAYHIDLFALGAITGIVSLFGLPWMCSATVQSLSHIKALSNYDDDASSSTTTTTTDPPTPTTDVQMMVVPEKMKKKALPSPEDIIASAQLPVEPNATRTARPFCVPVPPSKERRVTSEETLVVASEPPRMSFSNATTATTVTIPPPAGGGASAVAKLTKAIQPTAPKTTNFDVNEPSSIVETRLTGFLVHAVVLGSLGCAPILSQVPIAVVHGVFLFLGLRVIIGNEFIGRTKALLLDTKKLDPASPTERAILDLGRNPVLRYTGFQFACLGVLWLLKLNKLTAMIFPSVIGILLVLRGTLLPRIFSPRELLTLDTEMAQ